MKVKLGSRPKSFKRVVKFPMVDGSEGAMTITFKYRTRSEFGQFIDEMMLEAQTAPDEAPATSLGAALEKTKEANADYILKIAEGWDLDEEFNRENVAQLCDEVPGASAAIMDQYRAAIVEGRLGN